MGLFGGGSDVSSAQGASSASLNSSGWVIGTGDAKGGDSAMNGAISLPWYGWASLALIGAAFWRYRIRKHKGK